MIETPGEVFDVADRGIVMSVRNAVPLPIETRSMEEIAHPKLSDPKYHTCRNWQFANFLKLTNILGSEQ